MDAALSSAAPPIQHSAADRINGFVKAAGYVAWFKEYWSYSKKTKLSVEAARSFHAQLKRTVRWRPVGKIGSDHLPSTCLWIKSCFGLAHRSGKWTVAEIYGGTLDGVPFFVDNEAETPVLMKECQPITSGVLIDPTLAENRDLAFAHPSLNEGRLDIEPSSDNGCINAECALFKIHYGHGATRGLQETTRAPQSLSVSPYRCFTSSNYIT